jgi:REP element-mobilizing transposase RayT
MVKSKRPKQFSFPFGSARTEQGGSLSSGKRKTARPLTTKRPLHIVMKSSKAYGKFSFLNSRNSPKMIKIIKQTAAKFHIQLYRLANSGNHLHLLIQGHQHKDIQNFLRTAAAFISRKVTGATKGKPFGKFWDLLAYSRVVEWGRAFQNAMAYLEQNTLEALGFVPYQDRKGRTKRSNSLG